MVKKVLLFLCSICIVFTVIKTSLAQEPSNDSIQESLRETVVVSPEIPAVVELSNRDVNRIVCNDTITDVVYSQEKAVNVKIHQKNAFIKFQILKKASNTEKSLEYRTDPTEFYIVCGNAVYTIVALPKDIPAKTIRLGSSQAKKIESNLSLFVGLPTEQKIIKLIRLVYLDQIPESFTVKTVRAPVEQKYRDLEIVFQRHVNVEGVGLELKEYTVLNTSDREVELHEKDFVYLAEERGLGIAVENLKLRPKEKSRVFIVLRRSENE